MTRSVLNSVVMVNVAVLPLSVSLIRFMFDVTVQL